MDHQQSPFAALTGTEKQFKWLACKSATLPYVQGQVDGHVSPVPKPEPEPEPPAPVQATPRVMPPPETMVSFNKPMHHQYDAVIARMKQAEKQAHVFHSF